MADVQAGAAADEIPLELRFVGAPGCDGALTLRREVERRSDVVRWSSDGAGAGTAEVRITSGFSRYEAKIVFDAPGVSDATRIIASNTCGEALEGAALVIAVVLSSSLDRSRRPSSPPLVGPPGRRQRAESWRWELGVGASALTVFGIAPTRMVGFEAFGDASSYRSGWAPAVRLGLRHVEQRYFALRGEDVQAGFRLDSGRLNACPVAGVVMNDFVARACVMGQVGRLSASAYAAETKREEAYPWAGLGGAVRLEARVLSELSLELEGSYEATLFASRFWFSGHKFHESSRRTGEIAFSIVARLPQ